MFYADPDRYCILIEHPHEGLILWETGCGKDYPEVWGPVVSDLFSRVRYEPQHELRAAVEATGNKIEDIKKIIIGNFHLDHAGGLDEFMDRKDVEIWVHDLELRSAFWSVPSNPQQFYRAADLKGPSPPEQMSVFIWNTT